MANCKQVWVEKKRFIWSAIKVFAHRSVGLNIKEIASGTKGWLKGLFTDFTRGGGPENRLQLRNTVFFYPVAATVDVMQRCDGSV